MSVKISSVESQETVAMSSRDVRYSGIPSIGYEANYILHQPPYPTRAPSIPKTAILRAAPKLSQHQRSHPCKHATRSQEGCLAPLKTTCQACQHSTTRETPKAEQLWSRSWLNLVKCKSFARLDRLRALAENPSRPRPRRCHASMHAS
jgi:hypothetical protein